MKDNNEITVVFIRTPGLSGATWFNLVLGSHRNAMALGPSDWIQGKQNSEQLNSECLAHRNECNYWKNFFLLGNHKYNFFEDLAAYSGKNIFIINYPSKSLIRDEIAGKKNVKIKCIKFVRDGRAGLHSHIRHYAPKQKASSMSHILNWLIPIHEKVNRKIKQDEQNANQQSLLVRHEDIIKNKEPALSRLGDFIGIKYSDDANRFWEFEHHPLAGNTGVLDLLCQMQGYPGHINKRSKQYSELAAVFRSQPDYMYLDESWKTWMSHQDRLIFDCLFGKINQQNGYSRDSFSEHEVLDFWETFELNKKLSDQYWDENFVSKVLVKNIPDKTIKNYVGRLKKLFTKI